MRDLETLRATLPEFARDTKLNLQGVFEGGTLTPEQRHGVAVAAAAAMNNVYYRFRHLVGNPAYAEKPARLRMNRIAKPATPKADFELVCLAVSALNGCEACIQAHERAVLEGGLTQDHFHDAVRVAAVVNAAAVALEAAALGQPAAAAV